MWTVLKHWGVMGRGWGKKPLPRLCVYEMLNFFTGKNSKKVLTIDGILSEAGT